MVSVFRVLNFTAEVALAPLSRVTINGYKTKLNAYAKFCRMHGFSCPFHKPVLEEYLMTLWRKGNAHQSPESFRSALRKFCVAKDRPDPFSPRMNLLIKSFRLDAPVKPKKFFKIWELRKLAKVVEESRVKEWRDVLELMFFTIWQNVRISTLLKIKLNDIFPDAGGIYLVLVKGHRNPIWTILHPLSQAIAKKRLKRSGGDQNVKLAGKWSEATLNAALKGMCKAAGLPAHSWHDLRHTSTQYLNDLGYPNILMQCLGTWKIDFSMKLYLRQRVPLPFLSSTIEVHKKYIASLSKRLRRVRGKMLWLPSRVADE
jgi:site-specific recombinase XerD